MKNFRIYLALAGIILSSLACQAVTGGRQSTPAAPATSENSQPDSLEPTPTTSANNTQNTVNTDFPTTPDAYNVTEAGGSLIFFTKMSSEDTLKFYRDKYTSMGYTEREILTQISDGTFSIVFDGDPSGKAVVIQSVDLGDGSRTVSIRLEDV